MKKMFTCGHKGLGKFCHRCAQAEEALKTSKDKKRLESLARKMETKPEILAEFYKLKSEKLKAVPSKSTPQGTQQALVQPG